LTTFAPIFVPAALREAVSDSAWLAAMLEAERALADASAAVGVVPAVAAAEIGEQCEPDRYDLDAILAEARLVGNPAEPLVRALRERVGDEARRWVHFGATSQDIVDTAAMLVARNATDLICDELEGAAAAAARLAGEHRETPMAARTLLQQAVPTTFGAKAAGWLLTLLVARDGLRAYRFLAQLGGAAGTLAAFGDRGSEVVAAYASELDLQAAPLPWHSMREPWAALAALLDIAAGECAKIGLDTVLLAQTEVAEVAEAEGSGGSSTMPHKRNPVRAVCARACARLVHADASVLSVAEHEHERAAGAWQAEWTALSEALAHTGGAAAAIRECLEGLTVFPERMLANMTPDLYSERDRLGLGDDAEYLGATGALVDRALARWRERR
jgi:3-carboxy-cis,cis-muconate cycloisomerase